jgi:preprotein translocase subunit SecA
MKGHAAMERDRISDRFAKKNKERKLDDLSKKGRSKEDIEAEKELLEKTDKVAPLKADKATRRNDPCPCGSGKKYKKCCGAQ